MAAIERKPPRIGDAVWLFRTAASLKDPQPAPEAATVAYQAGRRYTVCYLNKYGQPLQLANVAYRGSPEDDVPVPYLAWPPPT